MIAGKAFDDVVFHDGIVHVIAVSVLRRSCEIDLCLGGWERGKPRLTSRFALGDMDSFFARFDFPELADNAWAGNVQDGSVEASKRRLSMHLVGGMLEAVAEDIELRAPSEDEAPASIPMVVDAGGKPQSLEGVDLDRSDLEAIEFSPVTNTCRLDMQVRTSESMLDRAPVTILIEGVRSCISKMDIAALNVEHRFGNVIGGHFDTSRGLLRLHLEKSFIEIVGTDAWLVWR
ncbi:hypothetical protein [Stenotrophomonas oahuensis]|uniref:Uncharacterized protein n=1 Tax=Stenotrophomonas oahuensis TaxID=3003271 RepID=A0ABY9YQN3_9GAMM|nr:hypothetical protein [Stenotrophomonas sp. A5586]WNH53215.1 hypothetical protein PDM29_02765 [Stenotrophomonas sp. A5586]